MGSSLFRLDAFRWRWSMIAMAPLVLAGLSGSTLLGQEQAAMGRRPNVLFLLTDDQRGDTIRALGNSNIETPHLDSLVRRGTSFTRATCAHPLCVPSRAEILTGCTGFRNGVHPPRNQPDLALITWPQAMQRAGYRTGWVGKWHLAGRPSSRGYADSVGLFSSGGGQFSPTHPRDYRGTEVTGYRGWIFQTDDRRMFPEQGIGLTPEINAKFADAAIEFIQRKSADPFFLHVNFTAPHDPLLIPPGYENKYDPELIPAPRNFLPRHPFDHGNLEGRDEVLLPWPRTKELVQRDLAAYYAVISYLDVQIGRVLKALETSGQRDNTLIVFSSDHGLALGSHGLRGKQNMYEHTINVPLILAGPGVPANKTCRQQCYLRDLFPTVCELTGVPIPETVQGTSLAPVIAGTKSEVYPFIVGYFQDVQRMIRTDRWKYVWYPQISKQQLFDLAADPDELVNLADDARYAIEMAQLREKLFKWLQQHDDPLVVEAKRRP